MTDSTPAFGHPGPLASGRDEPPPPVGLSQREVWGRWAFVGLAWIFAACVAAQVFIAGMAIFAGPSWWSNHTTFVHLFEYLPLLMLIAAFVGHMPARFKWLSLASFALIGLQYAAIQIAGSAGSMWIAALHPVNALLIFWLAVYLANRARMA